ncbi:MAG TPA: 30S ribosomal protein S2 [Candidatus Moranbacteria bacterium]|nr:30S ribosomal protein S2 [Candidatus Moranbacteria bacterium]
MNREKESPKKEKDGKDRSAGLSAESGSASSGDFGVDFGKLEINIENMFKSGVHFGHHKSRKNPKMNDYIFGTRSNINIFNLEITAEKIKSATNFISGIVASGQEVVFVGTKKQAKNLVESAAKACQMPYVSERWLGGTFTNFSEISKRTRYLRDGQEKMKKGEFGKYTKFEQMKIAEELDRLERKMGGIKNMLKLPGAIFAVSAIDDSLAIKEAAIRNIPVVALVDTNASPEGINYPIPANEDAVSSIKLMLAYMAKAVLDGRKRINEKIDKKE